MDGKVILVTGASSGIGRATAVGLARHGARLLLVGRNPSRCEEALAAVRATGGGDAQMLEADFSSLDGIRKLADAVLARAEHLDVLVNNAGTVLLRRTLTPDGYETTFAVNHLSYFLLTGLLLPLLRGRGPTRIVSVASDAHRSAPVDLDDLQNERTYSTFRVYGQSKSANILWTQELARRLGGEGVTANSLHPGVIRSNLGRGNGVVFDLIQRTFGIFMNSPDKGAQTSIYLATSPEVKDVSGRYFANSREGAPASHATDPSVARRLWEISEELVGFSYLTQNESLGPSRGV